MIIKNNFCNNIKLKKLSFIGLSKCNVFFSLLFLESTNDLFKTIKLKKKIHHFFEKNI